jgi:hypothetical protein
VVLSIVFYAQMRESVWCFAGGLTGKQKYLDVTSNFYETISKQASKYAKATKE